MKRLICLSLLAVSCTAQAPSIEPFSPEHSCRSAIHYRSQSDTPPLSVQVIGAFNDWTVGANPLEDQNLDGDYLTHLELSAGKHLYSIWVDGERLLDKTNPQTGFLPDGTEVSLLEVRDCTKPSWEVLEKSWSPEIGLTLKVNFIRGYKGPKLDTGSIHTELKHLSGNISIEESGPSQLIVHVNTPEFGRGILELSGQDQAGSPASIKLPFWTESTAFNWQDAIIYQIMVDRFRSESGTLTEGSSPSFIHGGHLDGITESIESGYFQALGANVLWLSPVIDNPEGQFTGRDGHLAESYHGYWPSSARRVEDRIGGEAALIRLVNAAHQRGIRVIIDHVLNHIHTDHPYYQNNEPAAWLNNPEGDCICGFSCPWSTHIQECWFDPFLADLNWESSEVANTQIDDALYWLEHFNLDGFRLDAIPMMPRMAIRKLRAELDRKLAHGIENYYLLGETYTGKSGQGWIRYYLGQHSLSGQFDFPVMWALRDALSGRSSMTSLADQMLLSQSAYDGSNAVMAPLMGNHDVARIISDLNGDELYQPRAIRPTQPTNSESYDLLTMAWTFTLTQPGAPVIYYGDEVALPGANDPDNRRPMLFGEQLPTQSQRILSHAQFVGALRTELAALRRGTLKILHADDETLVYQRATDGGQPILVAFNRSAYPASVVLNWGAEQGINPTTIFGSNIDQNDTEIAVHLGPRSSEIILFQGDARDQ